MCGLPFYAWVCARAFYNNVLYITSSITHWFFLIVFMFTIIIYCVTIITIIKILCITYAFVVLFAYTYFKYIHVYRYLRMNVCRRQNVVGTRRTSRPRQGHKVFPELRSFPSVPVRNKLCIDNTYRCTESPWYRAPRRDTCGRMRAYIPGFKV